MKVAFFQGKVKVSSQARKHGARTIEESVQKFIDDNPSAEILNIKQSSASNGDSEEFDTVTIISIWYRETLESQLKDLGTTPWYQD